MEKRNSDAKIKANSRYNVKTYDTISTRAKKTMRMNELLDIAADKTHKSKAQYILDAIQNQLANDNITPDQLPLIDDIQGRQ